MTNELAKTKQKLDSIKSVFKDAVLKDSQFCEAYCESESFDTLSDDEIVEMVCSLIEDSVETKLIHFKDVEECLEQLAEKEEQKVTYKNISKELMAKMNSQHDLTAKKEEIEQQKVSKLEMEVENKTKELENQIKLFNETRMIVDKIKEKETAVAEHVARLDKEIEKSQANEVNYLVTIAELRSRITNKDNHVAAYKLGLDEVEKQNNFLSERVSTLAEKISAKKDKLRKIRSMCIVLEEKEVVSRQEISTLRQDVEVKTSMLSSERRANKKLEVEMKRLKANLEKVEKQTLEMESKFIESLQRQQHSVQDIESRVTFCFYNL